MQEGRTNEGLSGLKREKALEVQRTRSEKKRDERRRREECAGRVDERRREEERIDEREREGESRVVGGPDPVDTTTTANIATATSTMTMSTMRDRARNSVPTRCTHRCTARSSPLPHSLPLFFLSRRIHLPILSPLALSTIRHFKREHPPSMARFPPR